MRDLVRGPEERLVGLAFLYPAEENVLREGDGVAIAAGEQLQLSTDTGAELLLFDLA